jgi:hypothetical protein
MDPCAIEGGELDISLYHSMVLSRNLLLGWSSHAQIIRPSEALLSGLEFLVQVRAKKVQVFDDSMLIVQHINGESQCFDGMLNEYREKCMDIVKGLEYFAISHITQEENSMANALA